VRTRIKICGVRTPGAVRAAVDAGADAVGFVFAESPRRISPEEATRLAARLPPFVSRVAVFRHPDARELADALRRFPADLVQAEPGPALAAARVGGARWLPVLHDGPELLAARPGREVVPGEDDGPGFALLEAAGRGGRGVRPDWERAAVLARRLRLVLAGGLTPENVGEAILRVRPWAVDVSSGVESEPGVKDPGRIEAFAAAVRRADDEIRARTIPTTREEKSA